MVALKLQRNGKTFSEPTAEQHIDNWEIFDHIRDISDPEHPYTLEQLNVVQPELIKVDYEKRGIYVHVSFRTFLLKEFIGSIYTYYSTLLYGYAYWISYQSEIGSNVSSFSKGCRLSVIDVLFVHV